jgi:uracil-DNA glycosylase family 4
MDELLAVIENCVECNSFTYREALKFHPKACILFESQRFLTPPVKNLFIAEAPPPKEPRYFYNTTIYGGTLRRGLFNLLGISDYGKKGLEVFRQENFLVDTIKCRLNKKMAGNKVPKEVIERCSSRYLQKEIDLIKPKNIILLGETAKRGISQLETFEVLSDCHIKQDCGRIFQCGSYRVILYAYPSFRNKKIMDKKPLHSLL